MYDYYPARPDELGHLTLYQFATTYEVTRKEPSKNVLPPFYVGNSEVPLFLHQQNLPAIPRIYPRMTPESHDEEYYYSMLLLHHPWTEEPDDLTAPDCETYHHTFMH